MNGRTRITNVGVFGRQQLMPHRVDVAVDTGAIRCESATQRAQ
ncbi:hypothetical protein [Nocardia arthritidis]|nr:hypothetical protein [Nocardia arthritidis]